MTAAKKLADIIHQEDASAEIPCQICQGTARWFGEKDFAISGNDFFQGRRMFEDTGVMIGYFRCVTCGFLFTPAFQHFTAEDWRTYVYNDSYIDADPPFVAERPQRDAEMCHILLEPFKDDIEILDFGGGTGALATALQKYGFEKTSSCDPVYQPDTPRPGRADVITCFEVVEHVADQHKMMLEIGDLMKAGAVFLFSTQLQPADMAEKGMDWWYIMPRNAHISIHSKDSLKRLMNDHGFRGKSLCPDLHMAWRGRCPMSKQIAAQKEALAAIKALRNPLPPTGI